MFSRPQILAFLGLVFLVSSAHSQELKKASMDEAMQHLTKRTLPIYPADAEVTRIQGDVIVRVTIDENGKVTEAKPVSGHPLLLKAAGTAVSQWRFQPFIQDGKPVSVQAVVTVSFSLGPDARRRDNYLLQEVTCTQQIFNKSPQAETPCKKALDIAAKLPKDFSSEKMRAYRNAGIAEKLAQKNNEAVEDFKQQMVVAREVLPAGSLRMVQVHNDLANAYEAANNLSLADAEYTETEKAQEASINQLRTDKLTQEGFKETMAAYTHNMQIILREHAQLLHKMEKIPAAEALEQKAVSMEQSK
jgi:TonB family protein